MWKRWLIWTACLLLCPLLAHADMALFLEEPYGTFGGMTPTGHAAIYLSRVCAETPLVLRRCLPGETGVVISRYHRVGGYDWIAIPLIPYLYAVERAGQVPASVDPDEVDALRDRYRRAHLEQVAPDESDGSTPHGDWTQLVGEAYNRTVYTFGVETSADQDDEMIQAFNFRPNRSRFSLLFRNCADFTRQVINSYYPKAIHRSLSADIGIMTPREAAECLVRFGKKHPELQFSSFVIPQVAGTMPRSRPIRGVLESLVKSKRYALPLAPLAVLHPGVGVGLAYAWVGGSHFDPRRVATENGGLPLEPRTIASALQRDDTSYAVTYARRSTPAPNGP